VRPTLRGDGAPWRIGHRGAALLAPENTIAALEAAVAHGVDLIEFDVLPLVDGTLVLAHSDDLLEVTHGRLAGRVRDRGLAELRKLEPALPTLDEALAFLAERAPETGLLVDVKRPGYEEALVEALMRHDCAARTVVSSYWRSTLRHVGALDGTLRLGVSYPLDRRRLSRFRVLAPAIVAALGGMRVALPTRIGPWLDSTGATVATLHYFVVSRAVVERCHARGAAVFAWTVDDPRAMLKLARLGVDGIVSNDPRILDGYIP
jgi:glycerophosphoryl diester phosphodiesterase